VFNVVDFGAIPNDGIDNTPAILAAVAKLKANGGGTLLFPAGRFQMTGTIELPPHSILRGLGAERSQIYWPDTYEPAEALVRGTHSFEVSDIFLTCGNHHDGIVGNWPEPPKTLTPQERADYHCGNITIRNVTLRMLYSQYINDNLDELKRRLPLLHQCRALRFGGENVNVTGNDIYCAAGGVFEVRAFWSTISDNRLCRGNIIGWNGFSGQRLIFADNHLGGANCTSFYGLPEGSEDIYWGGNYHENNFDGNNRETLTGDGRIHAYMDTVDNITPTSFTLIGPPNWRGGVEAWAKGAVQIAGGKGVGQIRRIKSIDGTKIELESAWDIVPDRDSVLSIATFRRRFIYTENTACDSSVALQLYGSMIEGIVANNQTARTGGYNGDAMSGESNWFNQFLNNTIETGNAYRGPRNEVPATDAQLGLLAFGDGIGKHRYPLVRSCVVRGNCLKHNARLNVQGWVVDSVLEKNQVEDAAVGATISETASNIVLSKNSFQAVGKPYEFNPQSVVIRPGEELAAALSGTAALLGWQTPKDMPPTWRAILTNPELADATAEQADALREKAVLALIQTNAGKPVTDKVVETLLGVKVLTPNWQATYPTVRDGKAGEAALLLRVASSRVRAHLKLVARHEDLPADGWSFAIPDCDLEPGKLADMHATLTKPAGKAHMLRIGLQGELTGAGWKLAFSTTINDPWDVITLDQFKVSRPLPNPLRNQSGMGYIKYEQIPKPTGDQLSDAPMESGRMNFASFYTDAADAGKIVYAVKTLTAKAPVQAKFEFSSNCLLFVNGAIVGTTLGRGQWGFANLQPGENKVELIILPAKRDGWHCGLPRIAWVDKAMMLE
jgi:hypothetical protein